MFKKLRSWHPVPSLHDKEMEWNGIAMETVSGFIFLGFRITADGDYRHEIKTLAPWKKSYDQPREHIKKQRHYFTKKVGLVKAMVFPVVMYDVTVGP